MSTRGKLHLLRTGAVLIVADTLMAGCTPPGQTAPEPSAGQAKRQSTSGQQTAQRLAQVSPVHEETGMTLLEGPTFGPDGSLYLVDVTAPPGAPKVMKIDTGTGKTDTIYSDESSVFTSAQLSPYNGRLYLSDFLGGTVQSITAEGEDHRTFFQGAVEGTAMNPDDIAFGQDGALYITDAQTRRTPTGNRPGGWSVSTVRLQRGTVLAGGMAAPNGIAFTPGYDGLWISHNTGNRVDYLTLGPDGANVRTAHPAIHVSAGTSQVDSLAVDAAGNTYIGLHNRAAILVYRPDGTLATTIAIPREDGASSATNLAIEPGTTEGYMTVSGKDGGFIYTFTALADGIRQSNGG